MPELMKPTGGPSPLQKVRKDSPLRRLVKIFRTNTVVKHHSQAPRSEKPVGVAKAFFKSGYNFQSSVIPGYGDYDRFARYCLTGETLIATTNQKGYLRLDEIVEKHEKGEAVHVFSYDKKSKELVTAPISKAWKTKKDQIWEVELDDGSIIRCTKDHPFMLKDGSYVEAQNLTSGTALMVFKSKILEKYRNLKNKYRIALVPGRGWLGEHKLVAEMTRGSKIHSSEGLHVHHKDFDGLNNDPKNLILMTKEAHLAYHNQHNEHLSEIMKMRWSPGGDLFERKDEILANLAQHKDLATEGRRNRQLQGDVIYSGTRDNTLCLGESNPNADKTFQLQDIIDSWEPGISSNAHAEKCGVYGGKFRARIKWAGFDGYRDFVEKTFEYSFRDNHSSRPGRNKLPSLRDVVSVLDSRVGLEISQKKISEILHTTPGFLLRLVKVTGFDKWKDFIVIYREEREFLDDLLEKWWNKKVGFQDICNSYTRGDSKKKVAKKLGVYPPYLDSLISEEGMGSWKEFVNSYQNHKVVSVRPSKAFEDVYDLTVPEHHNFAIAGLDDAGNRKSLIITHNSDYAEMESYPILGKALDILADEITQKDEEGNIIKVIAENKEVQKMLTELFEDILHLSGKDIYKLTRSLCKYGDVFYLIDATEEYGVVNLINMPASEVDREEGFDKDEPTAVRFRWNRVGNEAIPNAYVAHFRLDGNDLFKPYGNSALEFARRPWRQLVLLEDAMMVYRITRAPERRVYYLDIMGVPPEEIDGIVAKFNQTIKKERVVNDQGKIDLRYGSTMPVWKNTPVPLIDGRTLSIEELAKEYDEGKENWVYSIQDETNESVPGKVAWCGRNYTADKLTKVWLDDETWIMTAPEHPFVVWETEDKIKTKSVRADELQPGDSLVALYRKRSCAEDGYRIKNYELIFDHKSKKYKFTHRVVGNSVLSESREEVRKYTDWIKNNNFIVHHKDFNKLNNLPSNLRWMGNQDHFILHAKNSEVARKNIIAWNEENKVRPQVTKLNIERNSVAAMADYNGSDLHKEHNSIRKEAQLKSWRGKKSRTKRMKTHSKIELTDAHIQKIYAISKRILETDKKLSRDKFGVLLNQEAEFVAILEEAQTSNPKGGKYSMHIRSLLRHLKVGYPELKKISMQNGLNHKVSRIEAIEMTDDVYCMTVVGPNGEDDRHNFAAGCFDANNQKSESFCILSNSMEEDYVIPVRGQESGTRIDTLPGGQNASDIEDIEFIKKNLFASLGIPKAFLTFDEDVGAKSILTQEDIRFARTVSRIQEAIINELLKIAIVHLYLNGIRGKDLVDFELKMTNPSTVAELQKNELWRARMELVAQAGEGVFDTTFIYKHFLHLTDETIDMIRKGQIMDKMFQSKLMELEGGAGMGMGGGLGGMGMGGMGMGGGMGMDPMMGGGMGMDPMMGGGMPMESANPLLKEEFPTNSTSEKDNSGKRNDILKQDMSRTRHERNSTSRGYEEKTETTDPDTAVKASSDVGYDRETFSSDVGSPLAEQKLRDEMNFILREYNLMSKKVKSNLGDAALKASRCSSISGECLVETFGTQGDILTEVLPKGFNRSTKRSLTELFLANKTPDRSPESNKLLLEALDLSETKTEEILNSIKDQKQINILED